MADLKDLTPEEMARVKALDAAATPGPWEADNAEVREDGSPGCAWGVTSVAKAQHLTVVLNDFIGPNDAQFVAAARVLLPRAVAQIERLQSRVCGTCAAWLPCATESMFGHCTNREGLWAEHEGCTVHEPKEPR